MRKKLLWSLLASCLFFGTAMAQNPTVNGRVTDEKGDPISGASIQVKGTRVGASANTDGTFTLKAANGATLVVSALGYESKNVAAAANVTVKLATDVKALSEVVVTGSGVATSKKKLGISTESISSAKLPIVPAASIDQALIGKIPGAQISSVSGNPGDQVNIVLRGINTVQGGTRPLVLLDGVEVPFSSLTTIDLTQVDRVEVVQGAASASLYGAQGANGVIQIFTKKGQKGKINVNVSSSIANSTFINSGNFGKAKLHPYLTDANGNIISANASGGFAAGAPLSVDPVLGSILGSGSLAYTYGSNVGTNPGAPGETQNYTRYGILDPRNNFNKPYVGALSFHDHFAEIFQDAQTINNSININGGGEKNDFSLTVSNNHSNSPFLRNNGALDRTNITANIGAEVFKNFTIRSITNIAYTENTMHPGLGAPGGSGYGYGNQNANVGQIYGFLNTSPFLSIADTVLGGKHPAYQKASFVSVNAANPYYQVDYTKANSKKYDIIQNFEANYKINKNIVLNAKYGVSYKNENDVWTYYNQSLDESSNYYGSWSGWYNNSSTGIDNTGEIVNWQYNLTKQNFTANAVATTDFQRDFGLKIPITTSTLAGFDYRKSQYKELDQWGYSLQFNPPFSLTSTQSQHTSADYNETFVTYGYVVDQKIDWANHAGVTGGFRTDYSSAFGAGSKPFTFPHYNGYVNLESFKFFDGLSNTITSWKLRAAYGQAGIQPGAFDRYPVLNLQPTGSEVAYTNQSSAKNPNLGVEVSSETEFGTDLSLGLLKSGNWFRSLNASFTYWKRNTDNAIFAQNVPPSTGGTSLLTNAIALSSNGIQFSLSVPVVTTKNFSWDFTTNWGHQVSTIDKVEGGDIPLLSYAGSTGLALAAGRKIGELYGYKALTSVSQLRADGKTPFIDPAKQSGYEIVNGRVVNTATKAIFFSDEATSLGDPNPTFTSSFINNFTFKQAITFGFQFDWVNGAHLYNQTKEWMYRDGISSDFTKPVTIGGQTGAWSAYYASAYYALGNTAKGVGNNVTKDYFYYDASFVRLRNISLGVDLAKFSDIKWAKKAQLVLSGRNLLTFTKYDGLDPEISSGASNSSYDRGVDHSTIPNMKSFQISLNLGF
jgi:TonB-linked SusC/RagA family outer membrane protein